MVEEVIIPCMHEVIIIFPNQLFILPHKIQWNKNCSSHFGHNHMSFSRTVT